MSEEIKFYFSEDGIAREYDDTYDITIHCTSQEEQDNVLEKLNREECPDAISRQAAIYAINHAQVNFSVESEIDFTKHEREVHEIIENVLGAQEKALKELPPVIPTELEQESCENPHIYECSCGYGWDKNKVARHHFCPNCGVKMQEVEE